MGEVVSLGERLRQHREHLGLSQAQAARELDVARTAYRLWEMEAARPAPDRWRLIARWLGVSVASMLLAAELIDDEEAGDAQILATHHERSGEDRDVSAVQESGDFFAQEHSLIDKELEQGFIELPAAQRMRLTMTRIERAVHGPPGDSLPWGPARLEKLLVPDEQAPSIARGALLATADGIPSDPLRAAELLTSELVTNSVVHSSGGAIGLTIVVEPQTLRVEVRDGSPRAARPMVPTPEGGWGLTLVAELATRWGGGRDGAANVTWFEIDLPLPGAGPVPQPG
jgi:transcriptional regulator with XRE-family HTH domain